MKELTQQELIRVFSAYLPYNLKIKTSYDGVKFNNPKALKGADLDKVGVSYKPILYSMDKFEDYFSKLFDEDIDVRTFLNEDFILDHNFSSIKSMITEYKVEWIPLGIINLCLKHHFNIFGLDDSQYINKATLKK